MFTRLLLASVLVMSSSSLWANSYSWDFHNGHFDNLSLVPIGPGAVNLLSPTEKGLKITAPAGYNVKMVGFSPRFLIQGDFKISIDYSITNWTQPKSGYGSGPTIYVSMGTTDDPAASINRRLRPDGRDVYGVFAARVDDGKRTPTAKLFDVPSKSVMDGRLQIQRINDEIIYSAADDLLTEFHELATLPVSDSDVTLVRMGLEQSDVQSAATIQLHRIDIEADELPHLPSEQARTSRLYRPRYLPPAEPTSYRWLWQSLIALLVGCISGIWAWRRYT
ncbi:DUF1583 domain-containing protein [Rubinisphaera italica]|uniref:DUF1583 domain-containing protein n=1 Tax=Rubinisphaera italica TaxID=2527969 RepID=A0A5C5XD01_9PLAN|nr:DUF1583 domain-containing protein [Rubinisphaera italica]TWT60644.1 hypothetical protein Pan54_13580 [Rubinisphaera italica]